MKPKIIREKKEGKKGRPYQNESWAYVALEDIPLPLIETTVTKKALFIWSGIRNRYEWKDSDGMIIGMTKEQFDSDQRFKKVRFSKKQQEQIEWAIPIGDVFPELFGNPEQLKRNAIKQDKKLGIKRKRKDYDKALGIK